MGSARATTVKRESAADSAVASVIPSGTLFPGDGILDFRLTAKMMRKPIARTPAATSATKWQRQANAPMLLSGGIPCQ